MSSVVDRVLAEAEAIRCDSGCGGQATDQRGDLLLCGECARSIPRNVSARGEGWVKCSCGYDRPVGSPCGEPCM